MQSEADWKEIFDLYDKDNDNEITFKEAELACRALGAEITTQLKEKYKTQSISYEKFKAIIGGGEEAPQEDKFVKQFKLFDHDNDGSITTEELRSLLKGVYTDFPEEAINKIIASASKSGKVTLEEFKSLLKI